jgi:hypothetical protein
MILKIVPVMSCKIAQGGVESKKHRVAAILLTADDPA